MAIFCHNYKKAVKNSRDETASTILLQLIGAISILFLVPLNPIKFPKASGPYLLLLAASVFYAINNRLQTTARKNLEVATFSVINQLSFIFLTVLSFIFLRESITWQKIIAILLILLGNSLLLIKGRKLILNNYVVIAVASSIAAAIGVFISIGVSKNFNLPVYIALTFIIPALVLKSSKGIRVIDISNVYKGKEKTQYITAGVSWGLAIFFSLRAFRFGPVSVVAPLQATNVLINVVSSYFLLDEKVGVVGKVAAASLIVLAVFVNVIH